MKLEKLKILPTAILLAVTQMKNLLALSGLTLVVSGANAQVPQYELIKPDNPSSLSADFFQGGSVDDGLIDIDSDGDLDLHQSHYFDGLQDNNVYYINDGLGNFEIDLDHPALSHAYLCLADFDNDGINDIIKASSATTLQVFLGDGTGDFIESASTITLASTSSVIIKTVDIDLDGNMDILISRWSSPSPRDVTTLYMNDGSSNFSLNSTATFEPFWSAGASVRIAISGAYAGGQRDIAMIGYENFLYHYDGAGNFSVTSNNLFGNYAPGYLKFGDANGDAVDDLFLLNNTRVPKLYMNDGSGNYSEDVTNTASVKFGSGNTYPFGWYEDVTGDGVYDIMVSSQPGNINVFINNGTGVYADEVVYASGDHWRSYTTGDIDNDGDVDFVEARRPFNYSDPEDNNMSTKLFLNDGAGAFETFKYNIITELGNSSMIILDMDYDSDNDIVINGLSGAETQVNRIITNDGNFQFTESNGPGFSIGKSAMMFLDYNRNGSENILVVGETSFGIGAYINGNKGDGTFSSNSNGTFQGVINGDIAKLDIDQDNDLDIIISGQAEDGSETTSVYRNNGPSDYLAIATNIEGFSDTSIDVADVNSDGFTDVIICGTQSETASTRLYLGDGSGGFNELATSIIDITKGEVNFVDIDNNGTQDLIIVGGEYTFDSKAYNQAIYKNDGAGNFTLSQSLEGLVNATITVEDVDFDHDMDFISTGFAEVNQASMAVLYLNDGSGNFSASDTQLRNMQDAAVEFTDLDKDYDKDLVMLGIEGQDGAHLSRIYKNTASIPEINEVVQTCNAYNFLGDTLTTSGNYSKDIVTSEGEARVINLDLSILESSSYSFDIEAQSYYQYNGEILRESGSHEILFTNKAGCDSLVTLNLTITDFVSEEEYAHINYQLVQSDTVPQIQLDIPFSTNGESQIYDIDGDGDTDFLFLALNDDGITEVISYLNNGEGVYHPIQQGIDLYNGEIQPIVDHGDINGDGIEDLIIGGGRYGNWYDLETKVYFGSSDGILILQEDIVLPSSFYYGDFSLADFNQDGFLDIFITKDTDVFLYTNDGSGGFTLTPTTGLTITTNAYNHVISEPYDGGKRDVVVGDYVSGKFRHVLYQYDGAGNFTLVGFDVLQSNVNDKLTFADSDQDGDPDIVIARRNRIKYYVNDNILGYTLSTSETFDNESSYARENEFIDVNNDSYPDVLIDRVDTVHVYVNDGSGGFLPRVGYPIPRSDYVISMGDISDDGFVDMIVNGKHISYEYENFIYINDQLGGFNRATNSLTYQVSNGASAFADLNGDNYQDLVMSGNIEGDDTKTDIYINDQSGYLDRSESHALDALSFGSISIADIDGNETMDVLITGKSSIEEVVSKLYLNDGAAVFTEVLDAGIAGVQNSSSEFFDANGDGHVDVIISGTQADASPLTQLYLNDGSGVFTPYAAGIANIRNSQIALADVDGDDDIDVLINGLDAGNEVITKLYVNDGVANFTVGNDEFAAVTSGVITFADIDGDNDDDIYIAGDGIQYTYRNDGSGIFTLFHTLDEVAFPNVLFDDIDLDGDLDYIASGDWTNTGSLSYGTNTFLYINDGGGNFTQVNGNLFGIHKATMALADLDNDYDNDFVISGQVSQKGSSIDTHAARVYSNITCSSDPYVLETVQVCGEYEFFGVTYSESGIHSHTLTTPEGCERKIAVDLTILSDETARTVETCDPYEFNGTVLTVSGLYSGTFTNKMGCDSLVNLTLTILESSVGEETVSACTSYDWEGLSYEASGSYQKIITNAVGCDSTATLHLTISDPSSSIEETEACGSYDWNGTTYTESGAYQELFTNSAGCDSIAVLNLTILEPTSSTETTNACESYTWLGTNYTVSGIYEEVFTNVVGCDSLVTLNLTILEPTISSHTVEECVSYDWNGVNYTSSGSYQALFTNAAGCDSTATLHLTIQRPSLSIEIAQACGSYDWGGVTYSSSGSYEQLLTNAGGCDSTSTLHLTILPESSAELEVADNQLVVKEILSGQTYQWFDCATDLPIIGATAPGFNPIEDGEYYVEVGNGLCTTNSACAEAAMIVTALEDIDEPTVRLYPNPTSGKVTVELDKVYADLKAEVFNMAGQLVQQSQATNADRLQLNISGQTGIVMIRVSAGNEVMLHRRVLVR